MSTTIIEFENSPEIVVEMSGQGPQGKTGNGISSVELLSTVGLVNTYRINFTNGEYYDFEVIDGADGEDGVGIVSIDKTGTVGLVDTYTITLSDQSTYTFSVTNGKDGASTWGSITGDISDQTDLADALTSKANVSEVYSKTETDTLLSAKADASVVYTKTETDTLLSAKANATDVVAIKEMIAGYETSMKATRNYTSGQLIVVIDNLYKTLSNIASGSTLAVGSNISATTIDAELALKANSNNVYTKSKTDTLLSAKAPLASPALTGTPTAPTPDASDDSTRIATTAMVQDVAEGMEGRIIKSASGSIVSIDDAAAYPLAECVVGIEPVQDLHGYDNPWPAGGGKNLVNIADFTVTSQYYGTYVTLASGTYTLSFDVKNNTSITGTIYFKDRDGNNLVVKAVSANENDRVNGTFTLSVQTDVRFTVSGSSSGYNYNISNIMIESGSSATSYAPYSNICPISGWDEAVVTRTGKNLFFYKWENKNVTGAGVIENDNNHDMYFARVESGKQYTFVVSDENVTTAGLFKEMPTTVGDKTYNNGRLYITDVSSYTVTIPDGVKFIGVRYSKTMTTYIIEEGSALTTYEAPQIQTVTIDLDGTRYGGTLDVLTGEMTVTYGIEDLGNLGWTYNNTGDSSSGYHPYFLVDNFTGMKPALAECKLEMFKFVNSDRSAMKTNEVVACHLNTTQAKIGVRWDAYTTVESFVSAISGSKICYELATPFTVPLTPAEVSSIIGENHIWSSTGDTTISYWTDQSLADFLDNRFYSKAQIDALLDEIRNQLA